MLILLASFSMECIKDSNSLVTSAKAGLITVIKVLDAALKSSFLTFSIAWRKPATYLSRDFSNRLAISACSGVWWIEWYSLKAALISAAFFSMASKCIETGWSCKEEYSLRGSCCNANIICERFSVILRKITETERNGATASLLKVVVFSSKFPIP